MSAVRRYAVLLVILVVIVGLAVVFRDRLSSAPSDLQVGDCFDLNDPNATTVEEVPHHPCTESHHFEVFFKATDPSADGAAYPGTTGFDKVVQAQCMPAFATYVGVAFDDSTLEVGYLYPQADSWGKGRRTITCYASPPNNGATTTSIKGSKQ